MAALAFCLTLPTPRRALADDPWNPFAERDRAKAGARTPQRAEPRSAPRGGYLAPMTGDDPNQAPAAYPNTVSPSAPPDTAPNAAPPAFPYDSPPGTYQPPPPPEGWGSAPGTFAAKAPIVERGELSLVRTDTSPASAIQPVPATAAPLTLTGAWSGLDAPTAEQLLGPVKLPPASPAMSNLLSRFLATPLADPHRELVRATTLWRSGFALSQPPSANLADAAVGGNASAILAALLLTKIDLAAGRDEDACTRVKAVVSSNPDQMPANLRSEAVVIAGYCAIAAGKLEAGSLAAQLARDSGYNRPFTLALLEAVSAGDQPSVPPADRADLIDGLLALNLKLPDPALLEQLIANADPSLLGYLVGNNRLPAHLALSAAERAAALNVISPARLAEIYYAHGPSDGPGQAAANRANAGATERAALFVVAKRNPAQFQKTRDIRALLDSARRDGLYHPIAVALTPVIGAMRPAQEISWFCETAIEALAAGGDYQAARNWLAFAHRSPQGAGNLDHWDLLLDIADAGLAARERGAGYRALEDVTARGRFETTALHRLVTVLDALDYQVPIPLWNLASHTEQPQTGYLPETGILTALKKTSENRQALATALLALHTLASEGASATHLLGLGETIRALKRTGLEPEARRLAFEALFTDWPRTVGQ